MRPRLSLGLSPASRFDWRRGTSTSSEAGVQRGGVGGICCWRLRSLRDSPVPLFRLCTSFSDQQPEWINQVMSTRRRFHVTRGTFRTFDKLTEAPTEEHPIIWICYLRFPQQGKGILIEMVPRRVSVGEMMRREAKESDGKLWNFQEKNPHMRDLTFETRCACNIASDAFWEDRNKKMETIVHSKKKKLIPEVYLNFFECFEDNPVFSFPVS